MYEPFRNCCSIVRFISFKPNMRASSIQSPLKNTQKATMALSNECIARVTRQNYTINRTGVVGDANSPGLRAILAIMIGDDRWHTTR